MNKMKIIIENGTTLIKTGDENGGTKNKHNQTGVSMMVRQNGCKYRAEIQVSNRKYYLGSRNTIEEAAALRKEAEEHVKDGTFFEWIEIIKHPDTNSKYKKSGISTCKSSNGKIKYRADIRHNKKRHYLAKKNTMKEAYEIIVEAEKQIKAGTFDEWLQARKESK
jgi:leucyl aminopeptidase (aminopeptidase T)